MSTQVRPGALRLAHTSLEQSTQREIHTKLRRPNLSKLLRKENIFIINSIKLSFRWFEYKKSTFPKNLIIKIQIKPETLFK